MFIDIDRHDPSQVTILQQWTVRDAILSLRSRRRIPVDVDFSVPGAIHFLAPVISDYCGLISELFLYLGSDCLAYFLRHLLILPPWQSFECLGRIPRRFSSLVVEDFALAVEDSAVVVEGSAVVVEDSALLVEDFALLVNYGRS